MNANKEKMTSNTDQPYAQKGYELVGAAFEVHNVQGGGLLEEIYQQSLELELELRGIPFRRKQELTADKPDAPARQRASAPARQRASEGC